MKTIDSKTLGQEPILLGEEAGLLDVYDSLKTPISEDVISLHPDHARQIETYVLAAAATYGDINGIKEPTYVQNQHGLPALVVRVDCTVHEGRIEAYEMEDSPSGIGITDKLLSSTTGLGIKAEVLDHYEQTVGTIPQVLVSGDRRHGTDDKMVVGAGNYHYLPDQAPIPPLGDNDLVIVKAIPGQPASHQPYAHLQDRALAPLVTEGDKSYAERTGQLTAITSPDQLLQEDGGYLSQVVKARLGSMAMGISVYLSPEDRRVFGKGGQVKIGRLIRDMQRYIDEAGGALRQDFQPPIQIANSAGRNNMILRMFVLLSNHEAPQAQVIGGCYVARPELVVHGASNAVSGPVLVE